VQLFTGTKITGNVVLAGTSNSTLILDGAGQQLLSLAVSGSLEKGSEAPLAIHSDSAESLRNAFLKFLDGSLRVKKQN
jgi:hypothetical protein